MTPSLTQTRDVDKLVLQLSCDIGVLANPVLCRDVCLAASTQIRELLPSGFRHLYAFTKELFPQKNLLTDSSFQSIRNDAEAVIEFLVNGTLQCVLPDFVALGTPLSVKYQRAILKRHPGWLPFAPELFTERSCIKGAARRVKGLDRLVRNIAAFSAARRDRFDLVNTWLEQQRDSDDVFKTIVLPQESSKT